MNNLLALAKTIYGEARGEFDIGKIAVGFVVLNRVIQAKKNKNRAIQFGFNVYEVCKKKWQFSCWNENDPNFKILQTIDQTNNDVYKNCILIADKILGYEYQDPTLGATHYHVASNGFPKAWGEAKEPCVKIGNHIFYNNIA